MKKRSSGQANSF